MLKTKVKASSVTNLTDARYFAAMGVEWLGFNLDAGDPHYVAPMTINAIQAWVDGVKIVGELNLPSADELRTAVDLLALDAVQVGMFTPPETLMETDTTVPIFKEIIIDQNLSETTLTEQLATFAPLVKTYVLNFDKNAIGWEQLQSGQPIAFALLQEVCAQYPVLLSIDLHGTQILDILEKLTIQGIVVRGGVEEKVGFKSYDALDEILEALAED